MQVFENAKFLVDLTILKNIYACLFSVHNTISLSRHKQVCLIRLRFKRFFSHHRNSLLYYDVWCLRYRVRKTILLLFWANFCPFTTLMIPEIKTLKK